MFLGATMRIAAADPGRVERTAVLASSILLLMNAAVAPATNAQPPPRRRQPKKPDDLTKPDARADSSEYASPRLAKQKRQASTNLKRGSDIEQRRGSSDASSIAAIAVRDGELARQAIWQAHAEDIAPFPEERWLSQCMHGAGPCCKAWKAKVKLFTKANSEVAAAWQSFEGQRERERRACGEKCLLDPYEPTWSCESRERFPWKGGDGPKWACGLDAMPRNPLVFSVGSNGETSFERAVKRRFPHSRIFTFDPTLNPSATNLMQRMQREGLLTFRPIGLSGETNANVQESGRMRGLRVLPLLHMAEHVGVRNQTIDVLKVDIDGFELPVFIGVLAQCKRLGKPEVPFSQLFIEVHPASGPMDAPGTMNNEKRALALRLFFGMALGCGYAVFSKERNAWGCQGYQCVEYSLLSAEHAFAEFKLTHPSCSNATQAN